MKNGLMLQNSFNLATYPDSESSSHLGDVNDILRCIVMEVYTRWYRDIILDTVTHDEFLGPSFIKLMSHMLAIISIQFIIQ